MIVFAAGPFSVVTDVCDHTHWLRVDDAELQ